MSEAEMAARLVAAAERGFPDDRAKQLEQIARRAIRMPRAYTGVILLALRTIAERGSAGSG